MRAEFLEWYRLRSPQAWENAEEFFSLYPAIDEGERQQLLLWAQSVVSGDSTSPTNGIASAATGVRLPSRVVTVGPVTTDPAPAELGQDTLPAQRASDRNPSAAASCSSLLEDSSDVWLADARAREATGSAAASEARQPLDREGEEWLAGRYRVLRELGAGTFGRVVQAMDTRLQREVAVKIPRRDRFRDAVQMQRYLAEARTVATLDHPRIATVFDVETDGEDEILIVSKYIDGENLQQRLLRGRPSEVLAATWLLSIAEALEAAHARRVIHRDIKPANILIENRTDHAYITDFGLAVREDDDVAARERAGTWPYMSPEQVQGEGHRVDRRSDLYALGVIFYESLTGMRPFRGTSKEKLAWQIVREEPTPLRTLQPTIPSELERICLKLLAKRANDRYADAGSLVQDLAAWLQWQSVSELGESVEQPVPPRGLESFDALDASQFLELLPGLRNRLGVPDAVAFWVRHLGERQGSDTFPVGVLFGPSGSGKSSFFKAGVIPKVDAGVDVVYVEATARDTESRLLAALDLRFPDHESSAGVATRLKQLRMADGPKLVIVLDQFEQWLHGHASDTEGRLIAALRQCDGGRVQAVLLVRDDFAVALARLMQELEIPLAEGKNFVLLDLFDKPHARKVLGHFGRGLGTLPARSTDWSETHRAFVREAIEGLAESGRVVPVRLSLFAEMMRHRDWTPQTLQSLGGLEGLGVAFLQQSLEGEESTAAARRMSVSARTVLACLLPAEGVGIKGSACSVKDLALSAGLGPEEPRFHDLIQRLDRDLKLITPASGPEDGGSQGASCYQLTHDYLVPSLRTWLREKQQETRQGRALIALQEHAAVWSRRRDPKQLPGLGTWLRILWLTSPAKWTGGQNAMMRAATRHHGTRITVVLTVLMLSIGLVRWTLQRQRDIAWNQQLQLVLESLDSGSGTSVPTILGALDSLDAPRTLPVIRQRFQREADETRRMRLAFALARAGEFQTEFLIARLERVELEDGANYIEALSRDREVALRMLTEQAGQLVWNGRTLDGAAASVDQSSERSPTEAYRARLATALLCLGDARAAELLCTPGEDRDQDATLAFVHFLAQWPGDVESLHRVLASQGSENLRYGVLLGLGQIEPARVPLAARRLWRELATRWYSESPRAATHSAAGWLLRRWGFDTQDPRWFRKPHASRDWYVNSAGMTMVRIPQRPDAPVVGGTSVPLTSSSSADESLWFCDREVSQDELNHFLVQGPLSFEEAARMYRGRGFAVRGRAAAQNMTVYTAMRFCNWLSEREGLSPCYVRSFEPPRSKSEGPGEPERWLLVRGNGYRLPSLAEWQHACRHGASRDIIQGKHPELVAGYAWYAAQHAGVCGYQMPSPWGLFDMLGNTWEMTQDEVPDEPGRVIVLGGCWFNRAPELYSGLMYSVEPRTWSQFVGFRVVRGPLGAVDRRLPQAIE